MKNDKRSPCLRPHPDLKNCICLPQSFLLSMRDRQKKLYSMHLAYFDESGDSGVTDSPTRFFVLLCVFVHQDVWRGRGPLTGLAWSLERRMVDVHGPRRTPADFADEASAIIENSGRSRGLTPDSGIVAAKAPKDVDLSKLIPPESRPFADPRKLLDHGPFNWRKYEPIWVETDGRRLWLMNGVTRVENARRAGITKLPAYIFPRQ